MENDERRLLSMLAGVVYVPVFLSAAPVLSLSGVPQSVFLGSAAIAPALFLQGVFDSSTRRTVVIGGILWVWYAWAVYSGG